MTDNKNNIEAIYNAALEKSSKAERSAYLDVACADDPRIRERIEELLRAHEKAGDFLEVPVFEPNVIPEESSLSEGQGTVIGPYKLLELIGEGGFGAVYMAEQEEPIRRRVALKIIKLGMDTKQVIARFEAERQALAIMDHPNIAKVFDAGSTDKGRPYFVMELVKGIPITEYCDQNSVEIKQRLMLFVEVCRALEHAHQKGIIHRDVKPSNVMVTLHDGRPVPKIIDFGIAKAMQQRLTEKTLYTEFRQLIGTPEYMSPEQAEFSGLDVDIRTDIYSLGVLLYELLTGMTPFEATELRNSSYDEICKTIRSVEPPKPSTRLNMLGEGLSEAAKHRRVDPITLCKIVRGDLDWIVMKALEKDRVRRYETAAEFAADVQRHLDDEPVSAGPPSAGYRLHKFIRRHRAAVITVALVSAALAVGATTARFIGLTVGPGTPRHAEGMVQRHVWNLPYYSTPNGTVSKDGQVISYVDWNAGNLGVYNIQENTNQLITENTEWADSGGWVEHSVASPDGRQVVYSWYNEKTSKNYDLRITDTDGLKRTLLYRNDLPTWTHPYDWSADGQYVLAFLSYELPNGDTQESGHPSVQRHLVTISVTDASIRILKTFDKRERTRTAFFSPNGNYVAYELNQTDDPTHFDIYMIDLNSGSETALVSHPADDSLMGWSPDGRWILFSSERTGPSSLWAIEMSESMVAKETIRLVQQFDGNPVGFNQDNSFYYGIPVNTTDVYFASVDAGLVVEDSAKKVSSRFVGRTGNCDWSVDGKYLAFSADTGSGSVDETRFSKWALGIFSIDTGQERLIVLSSEVRGRWACCEPHWSPDGESVLVFGISDGRGAGPQIINVKTGEVNIIKTEQPWRERGYSLWSVDGASVYVRGHYASKTEGEVICRIDLETGRQTELYRGPSGRRGLALSPDGQWLAFWQDDALVVIPAEGGEPRELLRLTKEEQKGSESFIRWTPDGSHLMFPKDSSLWKVEFQSGQQQPMRLSVRGLADAAIHPDGKQIAFTVRQPGYELWILENFLPD